MEERRKGRRKIKKANTGKIRTWGNEKINTRVNKTQKVSKNGVSKEWKT